jgi:methyl-accepting chemotaxis protein
VEQGRGAVASVTETLESMATLVQDLSGQLAAIATATEQQSRAAQEVAGTVEELPGSAISPASMASRGSRSPPA